MMIYHGIRLYAVDSRDVGTFGGKAKRVSIKIYDGSCANSPRTTISASPLIAQVRNDLRAHKGNHQATDDYLRKFLPSNDSYRI